MLTLLLALAVTAPADTIPALWTPHRVYDAKHKRYADLEQMAAEAASSDVIFFGEQHDDGNAHRLERSLLEAVSRRRSDVIVSLEMFERDVQGLLDDYLAGKIDEPTFLKTARPWPNYNADYRPLVEFAKAKGWRVIAANVPRPIASAVSKQGLAAAIGALPDSSRRWAAADFGCPKDDYFERFGQSMGGHGPSTPEGMMRFYEAQCVKDETMAESIVRARSAGGSPLVIHMNGAFHSDYRDGTAERVARRGVKKITVLSAIPVPNLDTIEPKAERKKGEWLFFTLRVPKEPAAAAPAAPTAK
ncbi:MAG: ChaN family lipoprotein [Gemmatimonadales bacterium]|jgi:uncharacterized iron-regulated protein|nr:ChaN family lipoprotein [Gemmatimonadota bacterium]MBP6444040.1 ChaN family lipoprotein [Gemmatimonadales bacterium]MBP6570458.1 ChaN family lipoprotein [Gemmatimonadales bacterium]